MVTIQAILDFLTSRKIEHRAMIGGELRQTISGFSALDQYERGTMTWVKKRENIPEAFDMKAVSLVFLQEDFPIDAPNRIITNHSKQAFFQTIEHFFTKEEGLPQIGEGTYLSPQVRLGKEVKIGHHCVIDGQISIGDGTKIYHNVTIVNPVEIGRNCVIQSGVRIGHDGYGYYEEADHTKQMIKHYGGVKIGDGVFIGPNCVIYRGTISNTILGNGCKIDGLCHIGHNVVMKENVAVVAGTVFYGSVTVGKNAYISTSILRNQITLGEDSFIGMGSVVVKDVSANTLVAGHPAKVFTNKPKTKEK